MSPFTPRPSELGRGEDSEPAQEQTFANNVTGENNSAPTRQLEPGRHAQKKRLTHQQLQDEAMQ
jgi:hypothetical protein